MEVVCGSHTPHEYEHYADLAQELNLAISRGSDFLSPQESSIDLGGLPPDPARLTGVWELLQHRIC